MSVVTNVIISCCVTEPYENWSRVSDWIADNHYYFDQFNAIQYQGRKAFEASVGYAAFNYLDTELFVRYIFQEIDWEHPVHVQLLMKTEDELRFTLFQFNEHYGPCDCGHSIDNNLTKQVCPGCHTFYMYHWWPTDKCSLLRLDAIK